MRLIGTSKISTDNKITLIKDVAEMLGINEGDQVAFFESSEKGRVILKKAVIT